MEAGTRQREDVPAPLARWIAVVLSVIAVAMSAGITAHKAQAATGRDQAVLVQLRTPTPSGRAVAVDADAPDDEADGEPVRLPRHLLVALREARSTGDLGMFEDAAHELALYLVR